MDLMISYYTYFFAVLFALVSSLRFSYLPEIQLLLLLFVFFILRSKHLFATCLILVLSTNTYAIPDALLRLTPSLYPSVYTKNIISSIKVVDIISILTFFSSILSFDRVVRIKNINIYFFVFLIAFVSTVVSFFYGVVKWEYLLFYIRGAVLAIGVFSLISGFTKRKIVELLYLSMFCWVFKMIFMIIFPSEYVIQREILGIQWKIFFAGDEYLSFALISACIILLCNSSVDRVKNYKRCFVYCSFALLLAVLSQRKGAIPYFFIAFLMMYASYNGSLFFRVLANASLVFSSALMFFFFTLVYPNIPELYKLPFFEYYVLYVSAIDSVRNLFSYDPYVGYLGVGAMGLYEIISLPAHADHTFSFGQEVGNVYRYAIWNLPFGRLVMNVGLIGFALVCIFLTLNLHRFPAKYYIYFSILPIFGMYGVTPVSAIYIGFSLAVLYKFSIRNDFRRGIEF
ncbi:hypothetical protein [Vibrio paracholerae]|uniref:hypothetical protein n=1 Tax=Vibrio paracholerae TaxID=650003 RepID=UPI0011BE26FE|nr:hypothetical protein [Vibrio paracholerae]